MVGWIKKYKKKMDGWMDENKKMERKKRWMVGWIKNI